MIKRMRLVFAAFTLVAHVCLSAVALVAARALALCEYTPEKLHVVARTLRVVVSGFVSKVAVGVQSVCHGYVSMLKDLDSRSLTMAI